MDRLRDTNVHITAGSIVTVFLFGILAAVLWYLRDIVLIVLTAIVIASAIEPGIGFLRRYRINRVFSVLLIYLGVALAFFGIIFLFLPPLIDDAINFLTRLPAALQSLSLSQATHGLLPDFSAAFTSADFLQNISQSVSTATGGVVSTLSTFFGGVTSFVLIVVFSFYFSIQETGVDDFLRVVTPSAHQAYVLNLWKRSQLKIGKWMQGQLILGVIVGVLLYLGLTILGVPNALLLAVLAAVFELIPVFGQILAAIPAVAIGFVDGGVTGALLVTGLYVVVQQFEAHLIYPVVVKKVVGVPPLMVILSLIVGAKLAGFLGILLSVPIAGAIQEFVTDIDRRKTRELSAQGLTPEGDTK
ncbi:MAG TPA: AI-2E family transporter [Candidatus Paceibacterota bacterium]